MASQSTSSNDDSDKKCFEMRYGLKFTRSTSRWMAVPTSLENLKFNNYHGYGYCVVVKDDTVLEMAWNDLMTD